MQKDKSLIGYIRNNPHLTNEQIASDLKISPEFISKLRKYAKLSTNKK